MILSGLTSAAKLVIFVIILVFVISIFMMMPTVTIDKGAVTTSAAYQWIRAGLYFLPTSALVAVFSCQLVLWTVRVIIAIIKFIWELLPF